jgi:hypothetical protein
MTDEAMSPLRRRMIEDMTIRKLGRKTQQDYIQIIKKLATFLGRSPDTATLRTYGVFSCMWSRAASAQPPSIGTFRHCGSFPGHAQAIRHRRARASPSFISDGEACWGDGRTHRAFWP